MFFYLRGEEPLVHSNYYCCCTASATATLCFAFTHTLAHSLTHTSSHMRSPSLSVLIPPLSQSLHCSLPPSFHHLLSAIHPSVSTGFPLSVSASPCVSGTNFWQQRGSSKLTGLELFLPQFCLRPSHALHSSLTCLLVELHPLALGFFFEKLLLVLFE